jgi:hypothetical protein
VSRGLVQPFYRRTGRGGAGRERTRRGAAGTRPRQGHGVTGMSWLGRRELSARWPAAATPRQDRTGEGREERGRERRARIQMKFS